MHDGPRRGLTTTEQAIGGAIAVILGGIHWLPAPGVAELSVKLDAAKAQVTALSTEARATNINLSDIKTALAVTAAEEVESRAALAGYDMRIRALEIEEARNQ